MYTQRMFDMWSSVTSKLEAHANNLGQSNVQSPVGQNNSSGSIKGKLQSLKQTQYLFTLQKNKKPCQENGMGPDLYDIRCRS